MTRATAHGMCMPTDRCPESAPERPMGPNYPIDIDLRGATRAALLALVQAAEAAIFATSGIVGEGHPLYQLDEARCAAWDALGHQVCGSCGRHMGPIDPDQDLCPDCRPGEQEDEDDDRDCPDCIGTGIGQHGDPDTSRCHACGGSGVRRAPPDSSRGDYLRDRAIDDAMTDRGDWRYEP